MSHQAILLPGIVLPAEFAYPALIEALGADVDARAKELEVYAGEEPPPDYELETELAGILRTAEAAGFSRDGRPGGLLPAGIGVGGAVLRAGRCRAGHRRGELAT